MRKVDKNTAVLRRKGQPVRVILRHEHTGELAVAEAVQRGPKTLVIWEGREEFLDDRGCVSGGWTLIRSSEIEDFRIAAKRRNRDPKPLGGPSETSAISERDLNDFSSFVRRKDDE